MRQALVLAAAGLLLCLSGCADRANDLDTYYDAAREAGQGGPTPGPTTPSPVPTAPRSDPDLAARVAAAQLTDADVVKEGVNPSLPTPPESACLDRIPTGGTPPGSMTWQYPTGSRLSQEVNAYADRGAADVLASLPCPGEELSLDVPAETDGARGWCEAEACTVVLARGPLLSAVHVVAGTPERAAEAAQRLTPITGEALQRQP